MSQRDKQVRQPTSIGADAAGPADLALMAERFQCVIDLSMDYYWEQNAQYRFTQVMHKEIAEGLQDYEEFIGKTRWELNGSPIGTTWAEHRKLLDARKPFHDLCLRQTDGTGRIYYRSVSGVPVFDPSGRFVGYRGITRDITARMENARWLELERNVTSVLVRADDSVEAIRGAMTAICESEGWAAGRYWTLDEGRNSLMVAVSITLRRADVDSTGRHLGRQRLQPGRGVVGRVWLEGKSLWVPDLGQVDDVVAGEVYTNAGWDSAFLMPVFSRSKIVGVLSFYAERIDEPSERLLRIIETLGMQLGNFYERAESSAKLRESEERYSNSVEMAAVGICHVGLDGTFVHVNKKLAEMLGYAKHELIGMSISDISHFDDIDATNEDRRRLHAGEIESFTLEKRYVTKSGAPLWVNLTVSSKRDVDGRPEYDISIVQDITARKEAERRARYLATHDKLTGLYNRTYVTGELERRIREGGHTGGRFALISVDLDRFKLVNESFGQDAGDSVLIEIARRLAEVVGPSDSVARVGGDEFLLIVDTSSGDPAPEALAKNVLTSLSRGIVVGDEEFHLSACLGIATFPDDGGDAHTLMRKANSAMFMAKDDGRNCYRKYSPEREPETKDALMLEKHLRGALAGEELEIQYQPRVDISSSQVRGLEALLRWTNPEIGTVSPSRFIPVAEETGLIVPIGRWLLFNACRQCVAWFDKGLPEVAMSVNLSARQFVDPALTENILDVLDSTGMPPNLLELEITESMLVRDVESVVPRLLALKEIGVRIAIDDFGTGYSSLAQVKRFPIDVLKIDRSFVTDIAVNDEDKAITKAIVALGNTLGATVVAEGIENTAQRDVLRGFGCDEMQGFLFSRALSHQDAESVLAQQKMSVTPLHADSAPPGA